MIFLVLVAEPAMGIAAKASRTIFLLTWINFNKETCFFADYLNKTLMLSQCGVLVMETGSRSESKDFIEGDMENHQQKDLVLIMIQIQILIKKIWAMTQQ